MVPGTGRLTLSACRHSGGPLPSVPAHATKGLAALCGGGPQGEGRE